MAMKIIISKDTEANNLEDPDLVDHHPEGLDSNPVLVAHNPGAPVSNLDSGDNNLVDLDFLLAPAVNNLGGLDSLLVPAVNNLEGLDSHRGKEVNNLEDPDSLLDNSKETKHLLQHHRI